jgi:hypothetical protein
MWQKLGDFKYINTFFSHTNLNPQFDYSNFLLELLYTIVYFLVPLGPVMCYLLLFILK